MPDNPAEEDRMSNPIDSTKASRRPLPRLAGIVAGIAVGLALMLLGLMLEPAYAVALGANGLFLTYLALTVYEVRCLTPEFLKKRAADADAPVGVIFAVVLIAIGAAVTFLFLALNGARLDPVEVALSAVSVLSGWLTIHTMSGLHYAYEYYDASEAADIAGGLVFPGSDMPDGWAFLYFSFVIGMTAQVSDVEVTSNIMRRRVLLHGLVTFLFNTVIVAASVNVVVAVGGG
jgi:uncharacterized membrane protein